MNYEQLLAWLKEHEACRDAIVWVKRGKFSLLQAWRACEEPGWMAWYLRVAEHQYTRKELKAINECDSMVPCCLRSVNVMRSVWPKPPLPKKAPMPDERLD